MVRFSIRPIPFPIVVRAAHIFMWGATLTVGILLHVKDPSRSPSTLALAWLVWSVFLLLTYFLVAALPSWLYTYDVVFVPNKVLVDLKKLENRFVVSASFRFVDAPTNEHDLSKPWRYQDLLVQFFLNYAWKPMCVCLEIYLVTILCLVSIHDDAAMVASTVVITVLFVALGATIFIAAYGFYYRNNNVNKDFAERQTAAENAYRMRWRETWRRELGFEHSVV